MTADAFGQLAAGLVQWGSWLTGWLPLALWLMVDILLLRAWFAQRSLAGKDARERIPGFCQVGKHSIECAHHAGGRYIPAITGDAPFSDEAALASSLVDARAHTLYDATGKWLGLSTCSDGFSVALARKDSI